MPDITITQKQWELFCKRGEEVQRLKETLETKEHTISSLMGDIKFLKQELLERDKYLNHTLNFLNGENNHENGNNLHRLYRSHCQSLARLA